MVEYLLQGSPTQRIQQQEVGQGEGGGGGLECSDFALSCTNGCRKWSVLTDIGVHKLQGHCMCQQLIP